MRSGRKRVLYRMVYLNHIYWLKAILGIEEYSQLELKLEKALVEFRDKLLSKVEYTEKEGIITIPIKNDSDKKILNALKENNANILYDSKNANEYSITFDKDEGERI